MDVEQKVDIRLAELLAELGIADRAGGPGLEPERECRLEDDRRPLPSIPRSRQDRNNLRRLPKRTEAAQDLYTGGLLSCDDNAQRPSRSRVSQPEPRSALAGDRTP